MKTKFFRALFSLKTDQYREEIRIRNYHNFNAFLIVGTLISLMVLLFGLIMYQVVTFNTEFLVMFCYCGILLLASACFLKRQLRYITLLFYVVMTPLMFMAIWMGTFLDPTQPSITIMVFISVLPLFIMDKPWRVLAYITVVSVLYTICCFLAKDYQLFLADMVDLIAFYVLGIGVNCVVLNDRIASVENFVRYREKSETDLLTGLYNREAGVERIETLIQQQVYGAFLMMDIDDFKHINDNYGHLAGDDVLRAAADVIRHFFEGEHVVLRIGGDEFAVYAVGWTKQEQCAKQLDRLYEVLHKTELPQVGGALKMSLGCAIHHCSAGNFQLLYKQGDECLYEAKRQGKNCYQIGMITGISEEENVDKDAGTQRTR